MSDSPITSAEFDALLVIRCQLGEPGALDLLVERWHEPLWKYVRSVTDNDDQAADTVQDVWLRVLRALPRLRDPARLRAWLFGIARRALMDRLRQQYATLDTCAVEQGDLVAVSEPEDITEELTLMHAELARLPLVEREVLALFYLRELTIPQLADILGVPVGTVKSRLFRARQLLRRQLIEKGVIS